ncbi:MAG: LacI family DNA-binding transcriptional regulator, partial [Wenzhouxiangellaceae bacterium]
MTGAKPKKRSGEPESGQMTMADLARIAGVSAMTVSRALKDSPLVSEETRARIHAVAREHGYSLNVSARNLRMRRSYTIAVIVEMTPSPERPMSGSYPLELLGGIAQQLTGAGYSLLLSARHDSMTAA